MPQFSIIGKRFSAPEFADYVAHTPLDNWKPTFLVLHNTFSPTLAQRPNGFSEANMHDLVHYYGIEMGWKGGPHLFVDHNGIWVFNPLDRPGRHSPGFNDHGWGIEMLGNYDTEAFDTGKGLLIQNHTLAALAAMAHRLGIAQITDANFKLHKEDPETTHKDCPGKHVNKGQIKGALQGLLDGKTSGASSGVPAKVVIYRKGSGQNPSFVLDAALRDGTVYADAQTLSQATGISTTKTGPLGVRDFVDQKFTIVWNPETNRVYLGELI